MRQRVPPRFIYLTDENGLSVGINPHSISYYRVNRLDRSKTIVWVNRGNDEYKYAVQESFAQVKQQVERCR